jgi:hypothetical protein
MIVRGKTGDTSLIFDPVSKDNTFTADLKFIPESLEFDPQVWVLGKSTVLKVRAENSPMIQVFPVPVENTLTVYAYRGNIEHVKINDMAGRKVLDIDFKAIDRLDDNQDLDVKSLAAGIYIVEVETEAGKAKQRFMKR